LVYFGDTELLYMSMRTNSQYKMKSKNIQKHQKSSKNNRKIVEKKQDRIDDPNTQLIQE